MTVLSGDMLYFKSDTKFYKISKDKKHNTWSQPNSMGEKSD